MRFELGSVYNVRSVADNLIFFMGDVSVSTTNLPVIGKHLFGFVSSTDGLPIPLCSLYLFNTYRPTRVVPLYLLMCWGLGLSVLTQLEVYIKLGLELDLMCEAKLTLKFVSALLYLTHCSSSLM